MSIEKYLQAAKALRRARSIDAHNPELHVRLVHFRQTSEWDGHGVACNTEAHLLVSSLPQQPPAPIGLALTISLPKLLPDDVTLEAYNLQYLQNHSDNANSVLAFSKALKLLGGPQQEIESALLGRLQPGSSLDLQVCLLMF
jgi:N-alpha-acetyltransferase 15/16, NatA auxiliary subunit